MPMSSSSRIGLEILLCDPFEALALMTNILHRSKMDFSFEVVGERGIPHSLVGWLAACAS